MTIIFYFPNQENLAKKLSEKKGIKLGSLTFRHFPEGESYIKINDDVAGKKVILLCGLDYADQKIMALMFFAKAAKEFGAKEIVLVAPYLGYMRMDKRFNAGEAITSNIFAEFLSKQVDALVTIDPHLHRHKTLEEIYSIPCTTLHATDPIVAWLKANVKNPLLVGPDEESQQWVSEIAKKLNVPFVILQKIRRGDFDVEVSIPEVEKYQRHTPVLVDDIVATARTMIETVKHLQNLRMEKPVCVGVHAIFVGDAFEKLQQAGAAQIVSCDTIAHQSNAIEIADLIASALQI